VLSAIAGRANSPHAITAAGKVIIGPRNIVIPLV
jgi:hypothetical protein